MKTAPHKKFFTSKFNITAAVIIVLLAAVIFLLPEESIMGAAVKYVYIHVAFAFTATLGFGLMAVAGIIVLISNKESHFNLVVSIGWVSVAAYSLSIIISMISASISWGSVSLTEPYMVMSIQVLLAALVVQISYILIPWLKLRSLMSIIPIIFLTWLTNNTELVLHPASPIRDSSSSIIKFSFLSVFISCIILTGFTAFHLYKFLNSVNADVSPDNNEEV